MDVSCFLLWVKEKEGERKREEKAPNDTIEREEEKINTKKGRLILHNAEAK